MLKSAAARSPFLCHLRPVAIAWVALASAAHAGAAEGARFDIFEFRVEGNSLLSDAQVERAVSPHMGEGRGLGDVEKARAALERRYHEAGFLTVLVTVPEQQVDQGLVNLQVTEAPVSRLRVVGSQYHLPSGIRQKLAAVSEGQVPNFDQLQTQLEGVNRAADLKVAPVLKPGKVPGTVEVQLDVDDQLPLHGSVELNNRQSPNTSAMRLAASLRYDNLWHRGHSLGMSVQVSPENTAETRLFTANYMAPLSARGDALTGYLVRSRSEFATLANSPGLGLLGDTDIYGLRYSRPLGTHGAVVQSWSAGLDYKIVRQQLSLDGLRTDTPDVSYMPLSMSWRGVWPQSQTQPTVVDVSAIVGLRGLMGNTDEEFNAKREGASANFSAVRLSAQAARELPVGTLSGKVEGQLASGPLLPSEQFVGGGADSVRGYLEGERAGDNAARLSLEWASPMKRVGWIPGDWRMGVTAFVDVATLRTQQPGAGQSGTATLAGTGLGWRVQGPRGLGLQLDAARALRDGDVAGGGTQSGDWRLHGRLSSEF